MEIIYILACKLVLLSILLHAGLLHMWSKLLDPQENDYIDA